MADSATAPWLLHAPPWLGDHDDDRRAPKRVRLAEPTHTPVTRAEATLRKYALAIAAKLEYVGDWYSFVVTQRGRPDIARSAESIPHKAARLLKHLRRRGAGVTMQTAPWDQERLRRAATRGSHQSARGEIEFVCEEMLEFCQQGFWTVLPLHIALLLPNLQLSPLGVVPQRNRRPRLIVDYTYSKVNDDTLRLAPPDAMQFGKALQRILTKIVHADPTYGPVWLSKIDIADGFYRIGLRPSDVPRLGVILPTSTDIPLVALLLSLPMGWVESPPYFTVATETASDLLNEALHRRHVLPPHPLELLAATPPSDEVPPSGGRAKCSASPAGTSPRSPPLAYGDVYVDDFILAAQTRRQRRKVLRAALHSIDTIFRPLAGGDNPSRKEPVSVKKLLQGDACWATRKTVLGWDFDTQSETLNLPTPPSPNTPICAPRCLPSDPQTRSSPGMASAARRITVDGRSSPGLPRFVFGLAGGPPNYQPQSHPPLTARF